MESHPERGSEWEHMGEGSIYPEGKSVTRENCRVCVICFRLALCDAFHFIQSILWVAHGPQALSCEQGQNLLNRRENKSGKTQTYEASLDHKEHICIPCSLQVYLRRKVYHVHTAEQGLGIQQIKLTTSNISQGTCPQWQIARWLDTERLVCH